MGDRPGHRFRGNQWTGTHRGAGGTGTSSRGDWAKTGAAKVVVTDDPKAAGRLVAEELRDDPTAKADRDRLNMEFDEDRTAKNWEREFEGRIVSDPGKVKAMQDAVNANQENPTYRDIIRAQGGSEGVVIAIKPTDEAEYFLSGKVGGQRMGVITAVSGEGKLSDWSTPGWTGPDAPVRPGEGTRTLSGLMRHEFGHAVANRVNRNPEVSHRLQSKYEKIKDPKKNLTYYGGHKGYSEAFPEAIAIGSHRGYRRSDWTPEAADFIDAVIAEAKKSGR